MRGVRWERHTIQHKAQGSRASEDTWLRLAKGQGDIVTAPRAGRMGYLTPVTSWHCELLESIFKGIIAGRVPTSRAGTPMEELIEQSM